MNSAGWRRTVETLAIEAGATVELTGGNHLRVKHPSGWFVIASLSPRNASAARRYLMADIRRAQREGVRR